MSEVQVTIEYKGLDCTGVIIVGDWEGDPSVERGVHRLDPYVQDLRVEANGEDVTELLSDYGEAQICAAMLEAET